MACSDARYVIRRSQTPFRRDSGSGVTTSYRLEPGQGQVLPIGQGFAEGPHELTLEAVVFKGQCNGRAALSWRAIVTIAREMGS